jgi:hypothetical protein
MMKGRGDFATQCQGKTKYRTKGKAIDRIHAQMGDRHRRRRANRGQPLRMEAYRCCYCGHWHVGATFNWEGRMKKEREERVAMVIDRMLDRNV